jgi:hypothetical protein
MVGTRGSVSATSLLGAAMRAISPVHAGLTRLFVYFRGIYRYPLTMVRRVASLRGFVPRGAGSGN